MYNLCVFTCIIFIFVFHCTRVNVICIKLLLTYLLTYLCAWISYLVGKLCSVTIAELLVLDVCGTYAFVSPSAVCRCHTVETSSCVSCFLMALLFTTLACCGTTATSLNVTLPTAWCASLCAQLRWPGVSICQHMLLSSRYNIANSIGSGVMSSYCFTIVHAVVSSAHRGATQPWTWCIAVFVHATFT